MGSNPVSPTIIFLSRADLESESKGREFTTEQSLGGNAAELVGWAYRGTHETSNQWIGFT